MKLLRYVAVAAIFSAGAFCANIPLPFNTGVQNDGTLATQGSVDIHYIDPSTTSTVYVETGPSGSWLGPDSSSQWIGPDATDGSNFDGGSYTLDYQTTFDLTGYDPSTVTLTGQWSTDNIGSDILINGVSTGNTSADFTNWYSFTISSGFVAGVNTLDFNWTNQGGPGALRVEFTSLTGDPSASSPPASAPEPGSIFLMSAGALVTGLAGRKGLNRQRALIQPAIGNQG